MALGVDSKGELILAGYTGGSLDGMTHHGVDDIFVMKFDALGTWLWTHQRGTRFEDRITCIQVSSDDHLVVAGHSKGKLDENVNFGDADLFIMRLDSQGVWQWTRQRGSKGYDYVAALHLDDTGASHLVGFTSGSLDGHLNSGSDDLFAMHLATDGTWRWTQQRGTRYQDRATAMVVMGEEMYVTGYTKGSLDGISHGDADFFLMKLVSASGEHLWTGQVGSRHFDAAMAVGIWMSEVLVLGRTQGSIGSPNKGMDDILIQFFDPNGTELRAQQTGSSGADSGTALLVTGDQAYLAAYVGHHAELFISTLSDLPSELVSLAQTGSMFWVLLLTHVIVATSCPCFAAPVVCESVPRHVKGSIGQTMVTSVGSYGLMTTDLRWFVKKSNL
eukprot:symbB.v1.2.006423.t1/scaffold383.1/size215797/5